MKLLSINQDSKTIKGLEKGYLTGIMYLAPHTLGGKNICPFAKAAGCIDACLNTAGRGIFNNVQKARLNRTALFHNDINAFMHTDFTEYVGVDVMQPVVDRVQFLFDYYQKELKKDLKKVN
jgi:hypothetical protein